MDAPPEICTGQGEVQLDRAEFARRFRQRFFDPAFEEVDDELQAVVDAAWDGYERYRPPTVYI